MATNRDQPSADPDDPSAPLIIVNPRAARLADAQRRRDITASIAHAVLYRTGRPGRIVDGDLDEARAAIAGLASTPEPPLVVAAGGDGTIRDAAAALAGRPIPLAMVPGGTGNVLASALRLGSIRSAIEAIRTGPERMIDLGQARWGSTDTASAVPAREQLFLVACGMGLDARIMAAAQHEWKRRMLFGAYVGAALTELTRLRTAVFRITADGQELEIRGYLVLIANAGDIVPGRIGPRRPIDPTDGRLQLMVVGAENPFDGLRAAASLLLSQDELDGRVIRRSVSEVRVEAEPAQPIEIDGDDEPPGWLEARVLPGALKVLGSSR
jgi:diacylglycerol kinase family enzyme